LCVVGEVGLVRYRFATLRRDHIHGALGQGQVEIDDQNASTRARQQDRRRPSIADTIACRTATGDDGHFACKTCIILGTCLRGTHGWHSNPY
jgi:hypothetical protein